MSNNNTTTDFLLTRHILLNSLALTALIDLKEDLMQNDKRLYQALRQKMNKNISEMQDFHNLHKCIIPDTVGCYSMLDKLNEAIDKVLLEK